MCGFNYDNYWEDMLIGAEIINIPFRNSNIRISENLLGVEERCEV